MHVSNRLLVILAALCGLAAVVLAIKTPGIAQTQVYAASRAIAPGDILDVGSNLRPISMSTRDAQAKNCIPASLGALLKGCHCLTALKENDPLTIDAVVPAKKVGKEPEMPVERYFQLSGLLEAGQRAIAINSDAITSVGYALEPGDEIDLVMPGATGDNTAFRNLRVIAVGGRTTQGWVTPGPHEERYDTITLAVPEGDAEQLAGVFAMVGSARPRTVLHSRH